MRNINILNEDYIQLETIFGLNEDTIEDRLYNIKYAIDEAVSEYCNSKQESEDYLKLRYSPVFEELVKFDYYKILKEMTLKISNNNSIPLYESTLLSTVIKYSLNYLSENEIDNTVLCFGLNESNIPEVNGTDYIVEYTNTGKNNAYGYIKKLQEKVYTTMKNISSTDPDVIQESLSTLANIYILKEEPAYTDNGDELRTMDNKPYTRKSDFENDKREGNLMRIKSKNGKDDGIGVHAPNGIFHAVGTNPRKTARKTAYISHADQYR